LLNLEDDIQIQVQPKATYRTGDYWMIPARVATGVEWPKLRDAQGKIVLDAKGEPQVVALPRTAWSITTRPSGSSQSIQMEGASP
jgi:uncharacterized protein DUF6519